MSETVTVVMMSDTHGMHDQVEVPEGDILIHAGDFTKNGRPEEANEFNRFLGTLPHQHKIVVAGNHDWCFERTPNGARSLMTNCTYLQDESITICGLKFYGTPWQPRFFGWAFNLERGEPLAEKWALIPDDTDVLITHGPPAGILDITRLGVAIGCEDLAARVSIVRPTLHVFGHNHAQGGRVDGKDMFRLSVNASCCDELYQPIHRPLVVRVRTKG